MVESGRTSPDTERTKKWDNDTFLHLKVRDVSLTEPSLDLLLNDISGETFPLAMASEKVCRQLVSLARADHLVMFVDSSKISDFSQRHVHSLAVRDFLKMTLQTKSVGRHTILHVIFSRWDLLERTSDPQIHLDFIASLQKSFENEFASRCGKLCFWKIAARATGGFVETRQDIVTLFQTWVGESLRMDVSLVGDVDPLGTAERDFCRFRE